MPLTDLATATLAELYEARQNLRETRTMCRRVYRDVLTVQISAIEDRIIELEMHP